MPLSIYRGDLGSFVEAIRLAGDRALTDAQISEAAILVAHTTDALRDHYLLFIEKKLLGQGYSLGNFFKHIHSIMDSRRSHRPSGAVHEPHVPVLRGFELVQVRSHSFEIHFPPLTPSIVNRLEQNSPPTLIHSAKVFTFATDAGLAINARRDLAHSFAKRHRNRRRANALVANRLRSRRRAAHFNALRNSIACNRMLWMRSAGLRSMSLRTIYLK